MDWGTFGGWAGGIIGSVIGLSGGAFGVYCSIRNTRGPKERAFMIRASVACCLFVGLYLAALWLLPPAYKVLMIVPYVALLVLGIAWLNRAHARVRQEETPSD